MNVMSHNSIRPEVVQIIKYTSTEIFTSEIFQLTHRYRYQFV